MSTELRCLVCPRPAATIVTVGPDQVGPVCAPCLDAAMFSLSLTEPEGYGGYLSWREHAELDPAMVGLPPRSPEGVQ